MLLHVSRETRYCRERDALWRAGILDGSPSDRSRRFIRNLAVNWCPTFSVMSAMLVIITSTVEAQTAQARGAVGDGIRTRSAGCGGGAWFRTSPKIMRRWFCIAAYTMDRFRSQADHRRCDRPVGPSVRGSAPQRFAAWRSTTVSPQDAAHDRQCCNPDQTADLRCAGAVAAPLCPSRVVRREPRGRVSRSTYSSCASVSHPGYASDDSAWAGRNCATCEGQRCRVWWSQRKKPLARTVQQPRRSPCRTQPPSRS